LRDRLAGPSDVEGFALATVPSRSMAVAR
jgi:hypothetical protein